MELLRELIRLQHERGFLDDATLRELARRRRTPLYRLEELVSFYPVFRREPPPRAVVHACRDVVCRMAGDERQRRQIAERIAAQDDIELHEVSCLGRCDAAPAAAINDAPLAPDSLADTDALPRFLAQPELLLDRSRANPPNAPWRCDPYTDSEDRYGVVRRLIDSEDSLADTCIVRLKDSGLRGRGGAGFPTGVKWELVRAEKEPTKYVICNADESEPGTFKDRLILAQLPHLVIEGMLMAALTLGAERGIVYIRHEYDRERVALEAAIDDARGRGLLGGDGIGKKFDIEVFVSPGGYILGEETALLEALEDKRGEPRNKPPYPGSRGLWGKPTLINNVETFALAVSIIHHGADWWRAQGRDDCAGLKFISISGDVERPGVFEIPVGESVRAAIELAGGVRDGRPLKAFLPGGASSNFLTAEHIDTPLDFEAMKAAGSMLGTGAIIVFAEGRDLFDLATNLVKFFRNESCGKCVPCRVGSDKAVRLLEAAPKGPGAEAEWEFLGELGETLAQTSICGLGQVALNPILSMMRHFPDERPA